MKKIKILLLLIAFVNNLTSMQVQDEKVETILDLPNEILDCIVNQVMAKDLLEALNNWNDIFESPKVDLSSIKNLGKACKIFNYLCKCNLILEKNFKLFNNLKKRRFEQLFIDLKNKVLEEYEGITKEELNKGLMKIVLNELNNSMCINKKALEEGVKLILAGSNNRYTVINSWYTGKILVIAIQKNYKEAIEILINAGADVNSLNYGHGKTALILAVEEGNKEIAKMLINLGADVNVKAACGHTALMVAAKYGYKDVVEMLIKEGADVNSKNCFGGTALMRAAENGHKEVIEMLISAGADVINNAKDYNDGITALMYAAKNGHKDVVEMLISAGADVNIQDNHGRTALIHAKNKGYEEIAEILENVFP